jgi:hypothetical protein
MPERSARTAGRTAPGEDSPAVGRGGSTRGPAPTAKRRAAYGKRKPKSEAGVSV